MNLPIVAITEGDPAGIGPEIAQRAAADPRVLEVCEPVLYGAPVGTHFAPGVLAAETGHAAYDAIVRATGDAQRGFVSAVVTAPINKEAWRRAGLPWSQWRKRRKNAGMKWRCGRRSRFNRRRGRI